MQNVEVVNYLSYKKDYKNVWLTKYQGPSVHCYRCYFDDTFCFFNAEHYAISFFDFINSQHANTKFTMEKETKKALDFLDICVNNKDPSCLLTSLYRKGTFTGSPTNFLVSLLFLVRLVLVAPLLLYLVIGFIRAYKLIKVLLNLMMMMKNFIAYLKRINILKV